MKNIKTIKIRGNDQWRIKAKLMQNIPNITFDIYHEVADPEIFSQPVIKLGGVKYALTPKAIKALFGVDTHNQINKQDRSSK